MPAKVVKFYKKKKEDGTFGNEVVYFGTYSNFVTVRRPESTQDAPNYEDLQTTLERFNEKIGNVITWGTFF